MTDDPRAPVTVALHFSEDEVAALEDMQRTLGVDLQGIVNLALYHYAGFLNVKIPIDYFPRFRSRRPRIDARSGKPRSGVDAKS